MKIVVLPLKRIGIARNITSLVSVLSSATIFVTVTRIGFEHGELQCRCLYSFRSMSMTEISYVSCSQMGAMGVGQ